jgi:hypothetical protein
MSDRAYAKAQLQQKTLIGSSPKSSLLQRTCACGQHTRAGGECEKCRKKREGTIQRAAISSSPVGESPPIVQEGLRSPGQPLDPTTLAFMEPRFGYDFSRIPIHSLQTSVPQTQLKVNQRGDVYEQEADRVAGHVMRMPDTTEIPLQRQCAYSSSSESTEECTECKAKREATLERDVPNQVTPPTAMTVPPIVYNVLSSPGQTLDTGTRTFMEPRFGLDFSQVRIHTDSQAAESARAVNALAYTVGRNVVFGAGQYAPQTALGQRLLAHELTHVVQQSSTNQPHTVQRDAFSGGPGKTASEKDRPLTSHKGKLPKTSSPGGTVIPDTASKEQNCAGDSCSVKKWINWPFLGFEVPGVTLPPDVQGNWDQANKFVPTGCTRVDCSGVDVNHTRCKNNELELIAFLYRWPVTLRVEDKVMEGTQSDFHMMGRDAHSLPSGWHSKMDRREKVADIRDPRQSLFDSYPHTKQKDRTIQQLCFCCKQSEIKTV